MPNQYADVDPYERLMARVEKQANGCWLFMGQRLRSGHGRLRIDSKKVLAHRLSWELHTGQAIPEGMCACHKCDVAACVNPSHIFIGTHKDNMHDASTKRRFPLGARNKQSKLNPELVLEIRKLANEGWTNARLGRRYGVDQKTIFALLRGRTWRHVGESHKEAA